MKNDQERKEEVLKLTDKLRAAGIAKVFVSYYGSGDEGFAESPQLQKAVNDPISELAQPDDLEIATLGDLLAEFAPEGYQDNEGGHGTITFDVDAGKIRVEHNWYETVSTSERPREI